MISAQQCHGRQTFANRPPAGTNPWEWWYDGLVRSTAMHFADLGLRWAETRWLEDGPEIVMHYRLTPVQQTEALAHELHHLAIGGVCESLCRRNESIVKRETSRWLLPDVVDLAERLTRQSVQVVAKVEGLPASSILHRLQCLTPTERRAVDEVMQGGRPKWAA